MTKAKAKSQKIKAVAGLVLIGGTVTLSACSSAAEVEPATTQTPQSSATETPTSDSTDVTNTSGYQNGSYTGEGNYRTPGGIEQISVTVDLADGVITSVSVTGDPQAPESVQYQGQFISGISDAVVGKSIDEISVDRVAGSSLTSGGFNEAIAEIKEQAQG